ncbi:solute carrier family 2, facilitated glucose transporter member 11-like [Ambystoma mexicanum]|uniref:solute carrier family 2, facilitated glucose transporter member 11-like n=1 Tax=Ambystoma mexicanum TaxID=8296 RepID=UPI0037E84D63
MGTGDKGSFIISVSTSVSGKRSGHDRCQSDPPMSNLLHNLVHYPRLFQLIAVLGFGGSFQYGFQIPVLNSPSPFIKAFINETWLRRHNSPITGGTLTLLWSLIVSVYSIGGLIGALVSGYFIGLYGKRTCQVCNSIFPVVAFVLVACCRIARSFEMILIGRFLFGFNAGLGMNIHAQYLSEIAPKKLRGFTNVTCCIFVTFGKFCGQLVGLSELFGTESLWPYVMSVCAVASLVQLFLLPFLPETPPYLLMEKQDEAGCMKAVQQLWGKGDHREEIEEMKQEKAAMKSIKIMSVLDLLRDRSVRLQIYVMVALMVGMQLCGINAIYFYSNEVFREAGFSDDQIPYIVLGVGVCETLSAVIASFLIDRFGRRGLLLTGYSLMGLALVLLTVSLSLKVWFPWLSYASIALIILFTLLFGVGPAGVTLAICVEIFTQTSRAAALVVVGSLNWMGLYVVGMAFPYIVVGLRQYCFLVFLVCIVLTVIFCFMFLPETKGKSVLEVTEVFRKLKFPRQHVLGRAQNSNNEQIMSTRF